MNFLHSCFLGIQSYVLMFELFIVMVFCLKLSNLFIFMCTRGQISFPWMCFSIHKRTLFEALVNIFMC